MAKTVFHDLADGANAAADGVDRLAESLAAVGPAAKTAKTTAMDAALGPGGSTNPGGGPGGYAPGYLGPGGGSAGFNPGSGGGGGLDLGDGGDGGGVWTHERQGLTPPTQSDPRAAPGQKNQGALKAPGVGGTGIAYDDGHGMPAMATLGVPPTSTVVGVFKDFVFYPGKPFYDTSGGLLSIIGEGNVNLLEWIGVKVGASLSEQFSGVKHGGPSAQSPSGSGTGFKPWTGGGGSGVPPAAAPPPPPYSGGIGGTVNTNSPDVVNAINDLGRKLDRAFSMGTDVRGSR